jgi:metallo-beta-lactamase family protein
MNITFLGATGTVTGSKYLLEYLGKKVLIDCGLFQGRKKLRLRNWEELPVDPHKIDAIVLTHAHLDHSGYIPRLVKSGFNGKIYCSEATFDLCKILLPDSGYLQEEDAARANRYGYSKHQPAFPLYTRKEAIDTFRFFRPIPLGQPTHMDGGLTLTLYGGGHILGASIVRITSDDDTSIVFTGDLGRLNDPIMKPPAKIQSTDYLVTESTYGDRLHDVDNPIDDIERIVRRTVERGGSVVIPAFAVGRAQAIMYYLHKLKVEGRISNNLPVFLDSPMAISASDLLLKHPSTHRLSRKLCRAICNVATYTRTAEDSKSINSQNISMPKIIISASGMATGGRVLHHLKHYIGDPNNTILFAGFQAAGTRGDRLVRGETEIKIHGQMWQVLASIEELDNISAHADYAEILAWMKNFTSPPRKTFVVHGEPGSTERFREKIGQTLGWEAVAPKYLEEVELL